MKSRRVTTGRARSSAGSGPTGWVGGSPAESWSGIRPPLSGAPCSWDPRQISATTWEPPSCVPLPMRRADWVSLDPNRCASQSTRPAILGRVKDDLLQFLRGLRAVREYTPEPVAQEAIEQILEVGRWTSTGANRQPSEVVVVRDADVRQKFANWGARPAG